MWFTDFTAVKCRYKSVTLGGQNSVFRQVIKEHITLSVIKNISQGFLVLTLTLLLGLGGCSQSPQKPSEPSTAKVEVNQSPVEEVEKLSKATPMSADSMYKIMLAEMLVQRKQASAAFSILYPVAQKTRDPKLAERAFQLSMATFDMNVIKEAANFWREVEPDEAVPWKASYLMAVREGAVDEAVSLWQQYQTLSKPNLNQDLVAASERVPQTASVQNGLAFFNKLKQIYPKEAAVYFAYGAAAETYKHPREAISALENAANLYHPMLSDEKAQLNALKMYRETHHLLANAYLQSGLARLGLKKLADYLDDYPDDWLMQERYARLEVRAGLYQAAEERYLRVVQNEPKAYTSKLSVALLRLERKEYISAELYLKDLQKVPQYRSTATYYLGMAAQEQKHLDQAKTYFEKVKTSDYFLDAQLHLAEIEYKNVGLNETLKRLDALEATQVRDQVKILRAKAVFYNVAGKKQSSIDAYQSAIELDKNRVELYLAQASLYYDLARFKDYERNLKQVLQINENEVDALNALGYFYAEQNRNLDEAVVLLDKALGLAPNRYYILDSRGWLSYQQGQFSEAEDYLNQALQLQLDDEVLIHLIQTQWQLGKQQKAKELWQKYHHYFPQNKRLQKLMDELEAR